MEPNRACGPKGVRDGDAPELSSARLSSDSARAGSFSARLGSCNFWDSSFCKNLAKSSYLQTSNFVVDFF